MHYPPAVSVLVPASRWMGRLVLIFILLGSLQTVIFLKQNRWDLWQSQMVFAVLLMSLGVAWHLLRRSDAGKLQWTGEVWQWSGHACTGVGLLRLHLDFQSVMLVSLHSARVPTVWLWLERGQTVHQWFAIRRAIVHSVSAPLRRQPTHLI